MIFELLLTLCIAVGMSERREQMEQRGTLNEGATGMQPVLQSTWAYIYPTFRLTVAVRRHRRLYNLKKTGISIVDCRFVAKETKI